VDLGRASGNHVHCWALMPEVRRVAPHGTRFTRRIAVGLLMVIVSQPLTSGHVPQSRVIPPLVGALGANERAVSDGLLLTRITLTDHGPLVSS
jgi:hypothetical protein